MSLAGRAVVAVLAAVGGGGVGGAAVLLHGYWWGLLLGLAATAAQLVALPGGWWRRLPFAVGWAVVVVVLSQERPEGDLLVATTVNGYVLLGAGVGVLLGGVVGLRRFPAQDARITGPDASSS